MNLLLNQLEYVTDDEFYNNPTCSKDLLWLEQATRIQLAIVVMQS